MLEHLHDRLAALHVRLVNDNHVPAAGMDFFGMTGCEMERCDNDLLLLKWQSCLLGLYGAISLGVQYDGWKVELLFQLQ